SRDWSSDVCSSDLAADLGVSQAQLRDDLELLWVCGLPGYGPGDLIDMAFDGDRVTLTYDAGIDRPLRLTPDEAVALVVALRMLAETPDRKSTRLNSSHVKISYAVFCLKKKSK